MIRWKISVYSTPFYWQQGLALWLPSWFLPESGKYPERLMKAIQCLENSAREVHSNLLSFCQFHAIEVRS